MAIGKYTVHQLNGTTWAIEEKTPVSQGLCYLLCGSQRALLIDTGLGFAPLKTTVASLTDLPVTVACTHAHADHIRGNHLFGGAWYHEADRAVFALHTQPGYVAALAAETLPAVLRGMLTGVLRRILTIDTSGTYQYFADGHVFDLGGRCVEVIHTPGHTPGSVCFLDRAARMLFSGDTVCEWGVLLHLEGSCPPEDFYASMQRLKELSECYDTIWPGHHGFPAEKSYADEYCQCAEQLVNGSAELTMDRGRRCATHGRVRITVKK